MTQLFLDFGSEFGIIENMDIDAVNAELNEIAAGIVETRMVEYADELDMQMLLADPRFFGPDYGADDCDGFWYWELN